MRLVFLMYLLLRNPFGKFGTFAKNNLNIQVKPKIVPHFQSNAKPT